MDTKTQMIDLFIKTRFEESNAKVLDHQEYISFSKLLQPNRFRIYIPIKADVYPEMFEDLTLPFNEEQGDSINVYCHVDAKSDAYHVTYHVFKNK